MYELILTLHILICLILIVIVLIQTGKGAGLGGIFGGGNEALFSTPSGSAFVRKATAGLAIAFLCTTIILTILQNKRTGRSVFERVATSQGQ